MRATTFKGISDKQLLNLGKNWLFRQSKMCGDVFHQYYFPQLQSIEHVRAKKVYNIVGDEKACGLNIVEQLLVPSVCL